MESFEYYLETRVIKKITPDNQRAKSLINDALQRIKDSDDLDINRFSKLIFENYYDALRNLCDGILLSDGYKPTSSHEASISYLFKKGFDVVTLNKLDIFRYKRNGSKYYGEKISIEEAKDIKGFYLGIKDKLFKLLNGIK
jgi:hypothetical protein